MAEPKLKIILEAVDNASAKLDEVSKKTSGFGDTLKTVGKGAAIAGGLIAGGLAMATKAAADEEVGIQKLRVALANAGVDYDANRKAIEDVIAAQQAKTTFGDGPQREAISSLVAVTGDYEKAMSLLPLAMDLATAKGMDLTSASEIVGRVSEGNIGILGRYGVQLKEGATSTEALTILTEKFGGQAEAAAKTASGSFTQVQNMLGDMMEDIGAAVLPLLKEALGIFKTLLAEVDLKPIVDAVGSLAKEALPIATQLLSTFFDIALKLMPPLLDIAEKIFPMLAKVLDKVLEPLLPLVEELLPPLLELVSTLLDLILPLIELGLEVLVTVLGALLAVITPLIKEGLEVLVAVLKPVVEWVNFAKDAIIGWLDTLSAQPFKDFWRDVQDAFKTGVNVVIGLAEGWANAYIKAANLIIGALNSIQVSIPSWVPLLGGRTFGINIPTIPEIKIPRLAEGGLALRPTLALLGERGPEAVVPLNRAMGLTIIFNGPVYGFPDFERQVAFAWQRVRRRGGFEGVAA